MVKRKKSQSKTQSCWFFIIHNTTFVEVDANPKRFFCPVLSPQFNITCLVLSYTKYLQHNSHCSIHKGHKNTPSSDNHQFVGLHLTTTPWFSLGRGELFLLLNSWSLLASSLFICIQLYSRLWSCLSDIWCCRLAYSPATVWVAIWMQGSFWWWHMHRFCQPFAVLTAH